MWQPFNLSVEELSALLSVARGDTPADLLLTGGRVINVFTGEIYPAEVAIFRGRIAGVSASTGEYEARESIDLGGEYIAPGFIDSHVHIESSLLVPAEFAAAVLPHGTTSVVSDPHEIANVHGLAGIKYMLEASEGLDLKVLVMLSSGVPATSMETSGASLSAADLETLAGESRVLGVAEMMNYPGVVGGMPDMVEKAVLGHRARMRVDGHSPGLSGKALQAYISAGIASDHECVRPEEALEKLRAGMQVLIREGSTARNLDALLPVVTPENSRFCSFATDDRQPDDLEKEGHIDHVVRRAIASGLDPVTAIRMATINTARHYGLNDMGGIAPGYHADLITFSDLGNIRVSRTFSGGRLVALDGRLTIEQTSGATPPMNNMVAPQLSGRSFEIGAGTGPVKVIGVVPEQIVTRLVKARPTLRDNQVVADPERDILKMAVIERHKGSGNIGVALVEGFGLKKGALASTVAHDSHNIVVIGASDDEMLLAVKTIKSMNGGLCAVSGGQVLASLPLPVAGLMSDRPLGEVRSSMENLLEASAALGCPLSNPFMAMAFLALPVIPELKLTDMGLVDVTQFRLTSLFVDEKSEVGAQT